MLRAVWNTRSSSQLAFCSATIAARRLCSRSQTMFMTVLPTVELPCSRPTAKKVSFCSSGAPRRMTSVMNVGSNRPSNSGLKRSASPAPVRGSNRYSGYSSPLMVWLLSRPWSKERSTLVWLIVRP